MSYTSIKYFFPWSLLQVAPNNVCHLKKLYNIDSNLNYFGRKKGNIYYMHYIRLKLHTRILAPILVPTTNSGALDLSLWR